MKYTNLKSSRSKNNLLLVISITCVCTMIFLWWRMLENIVVISIDDVMYSDFARHGFDYFIQKNIWHYNNFNGRVFVHVVEQLVLLLNEHLYAILIPFFLTFMSYTFSKIINPQWDKKSRLFMCALVMLLFSGLTHRYTLTVFWISSGFNYVFPLFIISLAYYCFINYSSKPKYAFTYILLFIAGATTEQNGMYMIGLIAITLFFNIISKSSIIHNIIGLIFSLLGYLTIFLSPATSGRLTEHSLKTNILSGFIDNNNYITGIYSSIYIYIYIYIFFSILPLAYHKKSENIFVNIKFHKLIYLGYPLAVLSFIFDKINLTFINGFLFAIYIIILCIIFTINKSTRELGKLIICGYGSFFMMCVTENGQYGYRTCIPFVLSMLIVISYFTVYTIKNSSKKILIAIPTFLVCLICLLNYRSDSINYRLSATWCQNLYDNFTASKDTQTIEYDYDELIRRNTPRYRYSTLFEQSGTMWSFKNRFQIPDNVNYLIHSQILEVSTASLQNINCYSPVVRYNNKIYVPIDLFVLTTENADEVYFELQSKYYIYNYKDNILYLINASNELITIKQSFDTYLIDKWTLPQINIEITELCDTFGLDYIYDEADNKYIFTISNS